MQRFLLKSKIHRATVTEANLDYEGSVTIDETLMRAANIVEYEQVRIYDVTNGNRIITYAMIGPAGSGVICINGAAAHKVHPGDLVILATYSLMSEQDQYGFKPQIVQVDAQNRAAEVNRQPYGDPTSPASGTTVSRADLPGVMLPN